MELHEDEQIRHLTCHLSTVDDEHRAGHKCRVFRGQVYKKWSKFGRVSCAAQQIAASTTMILGTILAFGAPVWFGVTISQVVDFRAAITDPKPSFGWAWLTSIG